MRRHLEKLGYFTNENGMCFGIALMAMQAILAKDLQSFYSRVAILYDTDENTLAAEIEKAEQDRIGYIHTIKITLQKEYETKDILSEEQKKVYDKELNRRIAEEEKKKSQRERLLLSIKSFFDGLSLYFHPWLFPEFFERKLTANIQYQYLETTFNHTLPTALIRKEERADFNIEDKPITVIQEIADVEKVADFHGFYDVDDLIQYFTLLQTAFEKSRITEPVSLLWLASNHTTTFGWFPKKGWCIVDPNNLRTPPQMIQIKQLSVMLRSIKSFSTFSTEIFSKKNTKEQLKPFLEECFSTTQWQEIHKITPEKAAAMSPNTNWLFIAAREGDNDAVKKLIENKANINHQCSDDGTSPLSIATQMNHLNTVKILVENKANTDLPNNSGRTPLYIAAESGNLPMVEYFIAKGANIELQTKDETPFFAAIKEGQVEVCRMLINKKANIEHERKDGARPSLIAAEYGQLEVVKLLFENKVDFEHADNDGANPLLAAAAKGHFDVVKFLIEKKAESERPLKNGMTPLFLAINNNDHNTSHLLLNQPGINVNSKINVPVLLLLNKARNKEIKENLQVLFRTKGINGRNIAGFTILHAAAMSGDAKTMVSLLKAGIDTTPDTQGNISAYDLANAMNHPDIMEILLPYKAFNELKMNDFNCLSVKKLDQLKNQPEKFKNSFENFNTLNRLGSELNTILLKHEDKDTLIKLTQIKMLREYVKLAFNEFAEAKTNNQEVDATKIVTDAIKHLISSSNTEKDLVFFQKNQPFLKDLSSFLLRYQSSMNKADQYSTRPL